MQHDNAYPTRPDVQQMIENLYNKIKAEGSIGPYKAHIERGQIRFKLDIRKMLLQQMVGIHVTLFENSGDAHRHATLCRLCTTF